MPQKTLENKAFFAASAPFGYLGRKSWRGLKITLLHPCVSETICFLLPIPVRATLNVIDNWTDYESQITLRYLLRPTKLSVVQVSKETYVL